MNRTGRIAAGSIAAAIIAAAGISASSGADNPQSKPVFSAAERLGVVPNAALQEKALDLESVREMAISKCMSMAGFEYRPEVAVEASSSSASTSGSWNDKYRGTLDRKRVSKYWTTLTGSVPGVDGVSADESRRLDKNGDNSISKTELNQSLGCLGVAETSAPHPFTELGTEPADAAAFERDLAKDPGVAKAEATWNSCAKGKGFTFSSREDALDQLLRSLRSGKGGLSNQDQLDSCDMELARNMDALRKEHAEKLK